MQLVIKCDMEMREAFDLEAASGEVEASHLMILSMTWSQEKLLI